jgi:hypothetical protein
MPNPALMVIEKTVVTLLPTPSVAVMLTLVGPPAVVGLPLIRPEVRLYPAGRFDPLASAKV